MSNTLNAVGRSLQNVKVNQTAVSQLLFNCNIYKREFVQNSPWTGDQTKQLSDRVVFLMIVRRDYRIMEKKLGQEAQLLQWRSEMAALRVCFLGGPHVVYEYDARSLLRHFSPSDAEWRVREFDCRAIESLVKTSLTN